MKEHASARLQTLDRFMWPGGSEPKPPLNQNYVRMYGHNLCPFVARARWTFSCKQVAFQECYMDLNDKAQWFKDFNTGLLPILEFPTGEMAPESDIAIEYALQTAGPEQGINLIPSDPLQAALMRVKIAEFNKRLPLAYAMNMSRFQDVEKIDAFVAENVPWYENLIETAGDGNWLMGTEDLTLLDIYCGAVWDYFYVHLYRASAFSDGAQRANLTQNSPRWIAYMERIREHPKIAPVCMSLAAAEKHAERTRSWPQGQKCQLSLEVLSDGVFSDLP